MSNGGGVLANVSTVVGVVGTSATTVALVVGGLWAYFRFIKGRTYRPRLEVGMSGQWRYIGEKYLLHARITVRNIGGSKVSLLQKGTGLKVSVMSAAQAAAPAAMTWDHLRVFEILGEHEWIEPGETVSDDLLLDLGVSDPAPVLFEARLVWRWSRRSRVIVVFARQVIPVGGILNGSTEVRIDNHPRATGDST
jgi:hypothetical protein